MSVYALNLFDLADNDLYKQYSKRSAQAVGKYGGKVVALGRLAEGAPQLGESPRQGVILVGGPSQEAFDEFVADPEHEDLHPLREDGTRNYLWWLYDSLDDLR